MKNILEVDSVILEYGLKRILQDVFVKSETGKVTGLLGRNGSGKSSLMKIMYGEIIPGSKSIRLNGKALLTSYRNSEEIKYLPQDFFIPSVLTVQRIFRDFELDFGDLIMEFPTFRKCQSTKLKNLSGGERRIIEIYLILMSKAQFCILDEPFSQVMPIHVDVIKKLILREKIKKGIIVTDHLYKHIVEICYDLYLISIGKTHLIESIEDLRMLEYIN